MQRISAVKEMQVDVVNAASILLAGDAVIIHSRSKAIAVQREIPEFHNEESDFAQYSLFSQPTPKFDSQEIVAMNCCNEVPWIKVGSIKVLSVSAASVLQIGSNMVINTELRLKHFRQFFSRETYEAAVALQHAKD